MKKHKKKSPGISESQSVSSSQENQ